LVRIYFKVECRIKGDSIIYSCKDGISCYVKFGPLNSDSSEKAGRAISGSEKREIDRSYKEIKIDLPLLSCPNAQANFASPGKLLIRDIVTQHDVTIDEEFAGRGHFCN